NSVFFTAAPRSGVDSSKIDCCENLLRREVVQAFEMPQWTDALETRAALDIQRDDFGVGAERRRELWRAGTVKGDYRAADRGCDMHQSGIVGDGQPRGGEQIGGLGDVGPATDIDAGAVG